MRERGRGKDAVDDRCQRIIIHPVTGQRSQGKERNDGCLSARRLSVSGFSRWRAWALHTRHGAMSPQICKRALATRLVSGEARRRSFNHSAPILSSDGVVKGF